MIGRVLIFAIMMYKRFISPVVGGSCRFEPSCSEYAMEAIRRKGAVRGVVLALWRILRCNPFSEGGYDPIE